MARRFIHHIFFFIWEMCITEAYGQHSASNGFLIISLVAILTKKINKSEFTLKITKAGCKTYSRSEKHVKLTNNFSTHYLTPQGAMILCHIVGLKMQSLCTSRKKESKKDRKTKKTVWLLHITGAGTNRRHFPAPMFTAGTGWQAVAVPPRLLHLGDGDDATAWRKETEKSAGSLQGGKTTHFCGLRFGGQKNDLCCLPFVF